MLSLDVSRSVGELVTRSRSFEIESAPSCLMLAPSLGELTWVTITFPIEQSIATTPTSLPIPFPSRMATTQSDEPSEVEVRLAVPGLDGGRVEGGLEEILDMST